MTDYRGMEQGLLKIDIFPCAEDGSELQDEDFVDDPKELVCKGFICIHQDSSMISCM